MHAFKQFWPRLTATSLAWVANDFAFYGNKLFQSTFISLLYPKVGGGVCSVGEARVEGSLALVF